MWIEKAAEEGVWAVSEEWVWACVRAGKTVAGTPFLLPFRVYIFLFKNVHTRTRTRTRTHARARATCVCVCVYQVGVGMCESCQGC